MFTQATNAYMFTSWQHFYVDVYSVFSQALISIFLYMVSVWILHIKKQFQNPTGYKLKIPFVSVLCLSLVLYSGICNTWLFYGCSKVKARASKSTENSRYRLVKDWKTKIFYVQLQCNFDHWPLISFGWGIWKKVLGTEMPMCLLFFTSPWST